MSLWVYGVYTAAERIPRTSYQEATQFIEFYLWHQAKVMKPNSSVLDKVTYYPGFEYVVIYFQGRDEGFVHEKFPSELWDAWKVSESAGKFYHREVKGKYGFRLVQTEAN